MSLRDISPDNELPEDIKLPDPLSIAFMADRPELARLWKGPMDAEVAEAVAHALSVVMTKNKHLRQKLSRMRQVIEDGLCGARGQLTSMARKVVELDADAPKSLLGEDDD